MNNPNIQTYQITFSDGKTCSLRFDLTRNTPVVSAFPGTLDKKYNAQYKEWIEKHILPDLFPRLTPTQMEFFSIVGELHFLFGGLKI